MIQTRSKLIFKLVVYKRTYIILFKELLLKGSSLERVGGFAVKKLYNKRGILEVLKRFCYLSRYNYESKPTFKHKT
jgi:hypothetical protein